MGTAYGGGGAEGLGGVSVKGADGLGGVTALGVGGLGAFEAAAFENDEDEDELLAAPLDGPLAAFALAAF